MTDGLRTTPPGSLSGLTRFEKILLGGVVFYGVLGWLLWWLL